MVTKQSVRMSLEDSLKLPEEKPANELIDGEVCQKAMPKTPHAVTGGNLTQMLNAPVRGHHRQLRAGKRAVTAVRLAVPR